MYKTQEKVISELRELFDIENNLDKGTTEHEGKFYINKQHKERFEVISMLKEYFNGVGVKDGYLSVDSITFIHTVFTVCNGTPKNKT